MAIPYMGSKRKLAPKIIDYILQNNPNCKYIYDLFGGGAAISIEALKRPQFEKVYYNELNTGVVELLKHIRDNGITPKFYEWVDRETFLKHKNDNTWYGGYLKTCWSFGNNQRNYLYGKDKEEPKRLMHEMVVNRCETSMGVFNEKYGTDFTKENINADGVQDRRLQLRQGLKVVIGNVKDIEKFVNCVGSVRNELQQLQYLENLQSLQNLERLQRLQNLERLQRLQNLERLYITNLSYDKVVIDTPIDETVIYCDPPYKNTATYQENDFCHDKFLDWAKNSKYKVYVSSYEFDLPCVLEMEHRSMLSATAKNKVYEKLFCNRDEQQDFSWYRGKL